MQSNGLLFCVTSMKLCSAVPGDKALLPASSHNWRMSWGLVRHDSETWHRSCPFPLWSSAHSGFLLLLLLTVKLGTLFPLIKEPRGNKGQFDSCNMRQVAYIGYRAASPTWHFRLDSCSVQCKWNDLTLYIQANFDNKRLFILIGLSLRWFSYLILPLNFCRNSAYPNGVIPFCIWRLSLKKGWIIFGSDPQSSVCPGEGPSLCIWVSYGVWFFPTTPTKTRANNAK